MVLVDIFVPSVDKSYDFQLNESVTVKVLIEEIVEMISHKERCQIVGELSNLQLCDKTSKNILHKERTLEECNIVNGDSLILI